jgi:hypothetical protein
MTLFIEYHAPTTVDPPRQRAVLRPWMRQLPVLPAPRRWLDGHGHPLTPFSRLVP